MLTCREFVRNLEQHSRSSLQTHSILFVHWSVAPTHSAAQRSAFRWARGFWISAMRISIPLLSTVHQYTRNWPKALTFQQKSTVQKRAWSIFMSYMSRSLLRWVTCSIPPSIPPASHHSSFGKQRKLWTIFSSISHFYKRNFWSWLSSVWTKNIDLGSSHNCIHRSVIPSGVKPKVRPLHIFVKRRSKQIPMSAPWHGNAVRRWFGRSRPWAQFRYWSDSGAEGIRQRIRLAGARIAIALRSSMFHLCFL